MKTANSVDIYVPLPLFCCTFPPTFGGLKWVCILPPHSLFMSLISLECLPFQNNSIFSSFPFPYSVAPSPNLWWAQIGVYTSSLLPFCVSNASRVFPFPIPLNHCSPRTPFPQCRISPSLRTSLNSYCIDLVTPSYYPDVHPTGLEILQKTTDHE